MALEKLITKLSTFKSQSTSLITFVINSNSYV